MDWKIERIRDRCAACSKEFVHDENVVSRVELDASERVLRRDLCSACARNAGAGGLFWTTRFQQHAPKKKKVDFDRLLRIFEAWQQSPPAQQEALHYLIALLLVRKRFLRMADLITRDGVEFLRLRKPGPAERWYLAPAPLLAAADLPALRAQLEDLIDGNFAEEEMPTSTDAATATQEG